MKLGIIGTGMIVNELLSFVNSIKEIDVVAICGTKRSEGKVQDLVDTHKIPYGYTSVEEMLTNKEVEVVYVAVPNHLHYEFCKQSLEADKHVICEKPFTSNIKELETLVALSKTRKRILLEAVTLHYLPNMQEIKKQVHKLGTIKIVSTNYSQYSSRYNAFKEGNIMPAFNPKMAGGALMDLNIYNINFVVSLFGKPKTVDYQANIENGIDTSGILTLDYESFKCVCVGAKDCKAPLMNTIQGDKGCIIINYPVSIIPEFSVIMNSDIEAKTFNYKQDKHRMYYEFVEFVDIIHTLNYQKAKEMLDISLITMDIQTEARKKAGVIFPSDI